MSALQHVSFFFAEMLRTCKEAPTLQAAMKGALTIERSQDHSRTVRVRGSMGEGEVAENLRGFREAVALPPEDHPRPLERRVVLDPSWRLRPRGGLRGPYELPGPWGGSVLPGGYLGDRDPVPLRGHALREQGGPTRRQPLPECDRGEGAPPAPRRDDPLGGGPGYRIRPRLILLEERCYSAVPKGSTLRHGEPSAFRPSAVGNQKAYR